MFQQAMAEEMQADGRYVRVAMNTSLRKFLGSKDVPNIKPDVIGLTKDGKVDMVEILSPSQDETKLEARLKRVMNQLPPEMRGQFLVSNPEDAFK